MSKRTIYIRKEDEMMADVLGDSLPNVISFAIKNAYAEKCIAEDSDLELVEVEALGGKPTYVLRKKAK